MDRAIGYNVSLQITTIRWQLDNSLLWWPALKLVMGCYDTGSDTDTGFRYFFGFWRKSIAESIGIQKNEKLVMGGSDTGSDKK